MVRYGTTGLEKGAFTMNVSLGGAYVRTNSVYKPGTSIQLEFDFPQGKVSVWAQVVWAKRVPPELSHMLPCGMGVKFVNPGPEWTQAYEAWNRGA